MKPIRVLQIVPNMQQGGLENFIMNIYRNIDRQKVQFDFLVHYHRRQFFDDEIEKLGGMIYRFSLRDDNNIIKYIIELNKFYKKHKEYKVIHCHMSSIGFINFLIAKKNGIKIRIAHSHNSSTDKTIKGRIKRIMMLPYKYVSTLNYACSNDAGKYLYGNKKFEVIPNAIDTKNFEYNESFRKEIRDKLKLGNKLVIGNVGRFNLQKNHFFLIDIFYNIYNINKNAVLLLVGKGELENTIKEKVNKLGLEKCVYFLGIRSDINKIYQGMDIFLMPSLFEGLPLTGIEAQMSKLKCFFSDNITKEVLQTKNQIIAVLTMDTFAENEAKNISAMGEILDKQNN